MSDLFQCLSGFARLLSGANVLSLTMKIVKQCRHLSNGDEDLLWLYDRTSCILRPPDDSDSVSGYIGRVTFFFFSF